MRTWGPVWAERYEMLVLFVAATLGVADAFSQCSLYGLSSAAFPPIYTQVRPTAGCPISSACVLRLHASHTHTHTHTHTHARAHSLTHSHSRTHSLRTLTHSTLSLTLTHIHTSHAPGPADGRLYLRHAHHVDPHGDQVALRHPRTFQVRPQPPSPRPTAAHGSRQQPTPAAHGTAYGRIASLQIASGGLRRNDAASLSRVLAPPSVPPSRARSRAPRSRSLALALPRSYAFFLFAAAYSFGSALLYWHVRRRNTLFRARLTAAIETSPTLAIRAYATSPKGTVRKPRQDEYFSAQVSDLIFYSPQSRVGESCLMLICVHTQFTMVVPSIVGLVTSQGCSLPAQRYQPAADARTALREALRNPPLALPPLTSHLHLPLPTTCLPPPASRLHLHRRLTAWAQAGHKSSPYSRTTSATYAAAAHSPPTRRAPCGSRGLASHCVACSCSSSASAYLPIP